MKKLLSILVCLTSSLVSFAQTRTEFNLEWAHPFSIFQLPNCARYVASVSQDANNNILLTGVYDATMDLDPSNQTYTLPSGTCDVFVAKYDQNNNFIWGHAIQGFRLYPNLSAVDANGNFYIAGSSSSGRTIDFDPSVNNTATLTTSCFIVKYNSNGTFAWVLTPEFPITALTIDGNSNIYLGSYIPNTATNIDLDPTTGVSNISRVGIQDACLVKLNQNGGFVWGQTLFGAGASVNIYKLGIDASNDLYFIGGLTGTADFDPSAGVNNLTASTTNESIIGKFNSTGVYSWAKIIGACNAVDMSVLPNGTFYTSGTFKGTVDFDPSIGNTFLSTTNGRADNFFAQYTSLGNLNWVRNIPTNDTISSDNYFYPSKIVGINNTATIVGYFKGSVDMDLGTNTYLLTNVSNFFNNFITSYDLNGNFINAQKINNNLIISSLSTNLLEKIYIAGNVDVQNSYNIDFDFRPEVVVTANGDPNTNYPPFIAKYGLCNNIYHSINQSICGSYVYNNNTYNTSGTYVIVKDIPNSCGDSIITLNLTILANSFSTAQSVSCGSLSLNGQIYTSAYAPISSITTTGQYYQVLSGASANGCDSTISLSVTVSNNPSTGVILNNGSLVALTSNASYQWINCNGNTPINGAINQNFTPSQNGSYAVIITQNGCSSTSNCTSFTGVVGILEPNSLMEKINIYPNPNTGEFSVQHKLDFAHIRVSDLLGRTIHTQISQQENTTIITIPQAAEGIYIISILDKNHQLVAQSKILVQP